VSGRLVYEEMEKVCLEDLCKRERRRCVWKISVKGNGEGVSGRLV